MRTDNFLWLLDLYGDDCEEEGCEIMEISPGRFKATIHVAQ